MKLIAVKPIYFGGVVVAEGGVTGDAGAARSRTGQKGLCTAGRC